MAQVKVLFVCMGNICRSPTAQGVFSHMLNERELGDLVTVDSAGTHAYHIGNQPDPRARECALRRGIDISPLRARHVVESDFKLFDYVVAMDLDNFNNLAELCPTNEHFKLKLLMQFAPHLNIQEVPDPYYGGVNGFERVLDMIEEAAAGLITHIAKDRVQKSKVWQ